MRVASTMLTLMALLASGCEQNAVLEVTLDLPARPDGEFPTEEDVYAFVQIRDDDFRFIDRWEPKSGDYYAGTRLTDEPQEVRYSAVSSRDDIGLHMKVRFCSGSDPSAEVCGDRDERRERAVWLDFERPFYLGERTAWRDSDAIPAVPEPECAEVEEPDCLEAREPIVVGKCEIEGCIEAIPGSRGFCRTTDGTHFCE